MKTTSTGIPVVSIFLSSPGDVAHERKIAREVIDQLNGEFAGALRLEAYFWEYEPFDFSKSFQAQIPNPADFDVVLCFLWSRLGSRLHSASKLPDGSPAESGTEYEIAHALAGQQRRQGLPELHVWINRTIPPFPPDPPEVHDERIGQWRALKQFIEQWTRDTKEGVFIGSFTDYKTLSEFEELIEVKLRKIIERRIPEVDDHEATELLTRPTWTLGSPFRGLEPFEFEHAAIFFGRTGAVGAALESLRKTQVDKDDPRGFLLMLGASGSGKSSLARAGLMPTLIEPGVIEGIGIWRRALMKPSDAGGDVFLGLAHALLAETALPELAGHGTTAERLAERFAEAAPGAVVEKIESGLLIVSERERARQQVEISELIQKYRTEDRSADTEALQSRLRDLTPQKACLALLIDQLDELFTGELPPSSRSAFVETIAGLARSGCVLVLTTLRSDFYHRLAEYPVLLELAQGTASYHLAPPTLVEIGQIIRKPAQVAGLRFDAEPETRQALDESLRDAAAQDPQVLPLLEFALEELYLRQSKRDDGLLRWQDFDSFNRLEGVIGHKADECLLLLPEDRQRLCLNAVFGKLLSLSAAGRNEPVRRIALYDDLLLNPYRKSESDPTELPGARAFVDSFIKARLLVAAQAEDGKCAVSVAHEALLRSWPRLKSWISSNREKLRIRNQIDRSQADWLSNGKDPSLLLPAGLPLNLGEKILKEAPELLSKGLEEYIASSVDYHRDQRRRKRNTVRLVIAALSLLVVIATVASIFAIWNARQSVWNAKQAVMERDRAENLVSFLVYDLQKKLEPIGRLGILKDVQERTFEYFKAIGDTADAKSLDRKTDALISRCEQLIAAGNLQEARRSFEQAMEISRKLTSRDPLQAEWQYDLAISYRQMGNVLVQEGSLNKASEAYQESVKILRSLAARDPGHVVWQRDLSTSLEKVGDVQSRQGKLNAALQTYQDCHAIRQSFADKNPTDTQWQRDLAMSFAGMGSILIRQGKLNEAYKSYTNSYSIIQSLAKQDPTNAPLQSDLSMTFFRIGDVLTKQGKLDEALEAYQSCHAIRKSLAERDSANSKWQNDLSMSFIRVGDTFKDKERRDEALAAYQDSLRIKRILIEQDPSNASLQGGLCISLEKVGDALMAQGKNEEALKFYEDSLAIRRTLADKDPSNAYWRRGPGASLEKMGDALMALQKGDDALKAYQDALEIRKKLVDQEPSNAAFKHELSTGFEKLGDAFLETKNLGDAFNSYQDSFQIRRALVDQDSSNADWQKSLAVSHEKLGVVAERKGESANASEYYLRSLQIFQALANANPTNRQLNENLSRIRGRLDTLASLPAKTQTTDLLIRP